MQSYVEEREEPTGTSSSSSLSYICLISLRAARASAFLLLSTNESRVVETLLYKYTYKCWPLLYNSLARAAEQQQRLYSEKKSVSSYKYKTHLRGARRKAITSERTPLLYTSNISNYCRSILCAARRVCFIMCA